MLRPSKRFKVNEYITLELDGDDTVIYVRGELFQQCKKLILHVNEANVSSFNNIESIDGIAEFRDFSLIDTELLDIPPELEFWGHCSNLQAWVEHDYDARLLHSNLAFPLLKKLVEVGDPLASKIFKEEILKRLETGVDTVILYLLENHYFDHFTGEELLFIYENNIMKFKSSGLLLPFLKALSFQDVPVAHKDYKELVLTLLLTKNFEEKEKILSDHISVLSGEDLIFLLDKFRLIEVDVEEEVYRFRVLSYLVTVLHSQYGAIFSFTDSDMISTLLYKDEQGCTSDIFSTSEYQYIKLDFEADEVRRRIWREKLYYEFFEGHVVSIELLCDTSNKEIFYENLEGLEKFYKLEHITLLFFCDYDFYEVEDSLLRLGLGSIERIKIYEFSQDIYNPVLRSLL